MYQEKAVFPRALTVMLVAGVCTLFVTSGLGQKATGTPTLRPIAADLDCWASTLMDKASPKLRNWIFLEAARRARSPSHLDTTLDPAAIGAAANAQFGAKTPLSKNQQELVAALVLYQIAKLDQQHYRTLTDRRQPAPVSPANLRQPANSSQERKEPDKLQFSLQPLLQEYTQAEMIASNIMKKAGESAVSMIQKIG